MIAGRKRAEGGGGQEERETEMKGGTRQKGEMGVVLMFCENWKGCSKKEGRPRGMVVLTGDVRASGNVSKAKRDAGVGGKDGTGLYSHSRPAGGGTWNAQQLPFGGTALGRVGRWGAPVVRSLA